MKNKVRIIILTVFVMVLMVGCGSSTENFAGIWQAEDGSESLELYSDGTGILYDNNDGLQYSVS